MTDETTWPSLRFDFATGARLGPGKIELMSLVREHGSIRAAGAAIGMSYRRAWLLADETNRMFNEPVIAARHGGKSGGGAALTPFGEQVLSRYRDMEAKARLIHADDLAWLAAHMNPAFKKEQD
ncbi:winged helix-turn-helix domain-containing protein [Sinorhizobium sp. BG8]|uniref:winged helix-turn-helix domain-containing protein n=1 Tax=Sinorhizobium sp. BG8 TaxID=2613773 RepID=UPI00193DCA2D|nr:winged helix-turn-helix domain-containing protein [Sinorhizobium sp. BG8]QRM54529.1 LysR family transcriptional regulator [Sinorhizobium sp. BG8]